MSPTLSTRLQSLVDMVINTTANELLPTNQQPSDCYQLVWDTCCDHGQLGMQILSNIIKQPPIVDTANHSSTPNSIAINATTKVHFVDIQSPLIQRLEENLKLFFSPQASSWQTHTLSTSDLQLDINTRQLIVIAGVGGDLVAQFVQDLDDRYPSSNLEFLLCPVRQVNVVRDTLIERSYDCLNEQLVADNGRFYECIKVRQPNRDIANHSGKQPLSATKVSQIGDVMWQLTNDKDDKAIKQKQALLAYCDNMIRHYSQTLKNPHRAVQAKQLLQAYEAQRHKLLNA